MRAAKAVALIVILYFMPIKSLLIRTENQQHHFTSYYTTIGPHQFHQHKYNITLLHANQTDTCQFDATAQQAFTKGSILIIFGSLPNSPACTTDVYGKHTAMARLAQANGFSGVVIQSDEKFYSGRIVGFDSSISIPYLVVSKRTLSFIETNFASIIAVELPTLTLKDARSLKTIKTMYLIWRIAGGILYGSQLFIISYFLWMERVFLQKARKVLWQSVSLKVLAFVTALFSFMWVAIDPFGFLGTMFPSAMFLGIVTGCFLCIFMFLLQIWTFSVGRLGTMYSSVISRVIFSISAILVIISFFQGILWFIRPLRYATIFILTLVLVLCGFGFILTGRRMVGIIQNSNNMSADQRQLAKKISSFVIFYLILDCVASIIRLTSCLGSVVSLMAVHILVGIIILCTFAILFFPVVIKQQHPGWNVDSSSGEKNSGLPEDALQITVTV